MQEETRAVDDYSKKTDDDVEHWQERLSSGVGKWGDNLAMIEALQVVLDSTARKREWLDEFAEALRVGMLVGWGVRDRRSGARVDETDLFI